MAVVGDISNIITLIQVSQQILNVCYQYYSDAKNARRDIERLDTEVRAFGEVLKDVQSLVEDPSESLADLTKNCLSDLGDLQKNLNLEGGGKAKKLLRSLSWPFKIKAVNRAILVLERYKTAFSLEMTTNIRQGQLLENLPLACGAAFDSSTREREAQCLPDTRVELLDQIMAWSDNHSGECIFWLNGMAGTGKSTIARTVARRLADNGRLGGSFFFRRGGGDLAKGTTIFTTLARQLVAKLPPLKRYVCEAVAKDSDIAQKSLDLQWKQLILQPLSALEGNDCRYPDLVLVIDALDECESEYHVRTIIRLLPQAKDLENIRLRVFLTSRLETSVRLGFSAIPGTVHQDFVLHSVPQSVIEHDISSYIRHQLAKVKEGRKEHIIFPADWPDEQTIERLTQRADGLFIYAATVCRFIGDPDWAPEDRLCLALESDTAGQSPTWELDEMYTKILKHAVIDNCDEQNRLERSKRFRQIVGSIAVLFDSLSAGALGKLLDVPAWKMDTILGHLRSVLDVPESADSPIRLLHPSFGDFLLSDHRCLDRQFQINDREAHNCLAENCLGLMSKSLRKDICDLHMPGTYASDVESSRVEDCLSADVQYACRYWVGHLQLGDISLCDDNGQVHVFLQKHFLHWLEALSLMRKMSEGILMLISLQSILAVSDSAISRCRTIMLHTNPAKTSNTEGHPDLLAMVCDAKRFILSNRSIVEKAPLQAYSSAIIFSPERSVIRRQFISPVTTWIKKLPAVEEDWNPSLQAIEGHLDMVQAVAFSHDGHLLASGSADGLLNLWDPTTGSSHRTLGGNSGEVWSVTFSPDNNLLASGLGDGSIKLWDPTTGALHGVLEGHSGGVWAVKFSPDGQLLASGSEDGTVRLWDPATRAPRGTFEGHSKGVTAVVFSPDSHLLVSGSEDSTVRLWDAATGALNSTLEGHSHGVWGVAVSPVGHLIASGSGDGTVRVWDLATGTLRNTLDSHSGWVWTVAFSLDGHFLASGLGDGTVRLWDLETGALHDTLRDHSGAVWAVAFSPDGRLIASGSRDRTVRLWDLTTAAPRRNLTGNLDKTHAVALSQDRQLLASGSSNGTVRLSDPTTGASRGILEGHAGEVSTVAFSPDSHLLASGSVDGTARVWDLATRSLRATLEGHSSGVLVVKFSLDSKFLASGSGDGTVRVWNPNTGVLCSTLEGHSRGIWAVAFSPDGCLLASGSGDGTVRLWDLATGASHSTLGGHSGWVHAVAFSPDGHLLASGSGDSTIRLWDIATGASAATLQDRSDWAEVRIVEFSPDGRLLASRSEDATVRLWDLRTNEVLQKFLTKYNTDRLSFSKDASILETGREQIRLTPPSPDLLQAQSYSPSQPPSSSSYSLDESGQWITWNTHNALFLPRHRRSSHYAVQDDMLTIGHHSSRLTTTLGFDLGINPLQHRHDHEHDHRKL